MLKAESEFQERELMKMERERELSQLRRQHEREIYMLKRRLADTSIAKKLSSQQNIQDEDFSSLQISIPTFTMAGNGSSSHIEYQVNIKTADAQWTVMRRFRQFRDLHKAMMTIYGQIITNLPFPSRRIFGSRSEYVSGERQKQLCGYLNILLLTLLTTQNCPLFKNPSKVGLQKLSSFFHEDAKEAIEET